MKRKRLAYFLCWAVLGGCATASRTTQIDYLVEGKTLRGDITEEDIMDQLSRYSDVYKKQFARDSYGNKTKSQVRVETGTKIIVYPLTKPLIRLQMNNMAQERAYKNRTTVKALQNETQNNIATEVKDSVERRQCFSMNIRTTDPGALELKYWYGTLTQNGQVQTITYSDEKLFNRGHRGDFISSNRSYTEEDITRTKHYSYFAKACSDKPIDLTKAFFIDFDPRFAPELLPIKLEWLEPDPRHK